MSDNFRTAARALQPYISDTYDLLAAADAVTAIPTTATVKSAHDELIEAALATPTIMARVALGRKIGAVKLLRQVSDGSLKECKDAIESEAVWAYAEATDRALEEYGQVIRNRY